MTSAAKVEQAVATLPARQVHGRLAGLRRETARCHDAVERRVDIVGRLGSRGRYADLLARLHGFYEPFEAELDTAVARWELPIDMEARRKAPLIRRDLVALGISPPAIAGLAQCGWTPRPTCPANALGVLYVTEGATLGSRLIAREVKERLGLDPATGASFFHGYGRDAGVRWRTFCSVLAGASRSAAAERAILAGALETFGAYERWLADENYT